MQIKTEKPPERQTLIRGTAADETGRASGLTQPLQIDGHEGLVGKNEVWWDDRDDSLEGTRRSRLMFFKKIQLCYDEVVS